MTEVQQGRVNWRPVIERSRELERTIKLSYLQFVVGLVPLFYMAIVWLLDGEPGLLLLAAGISGAIFASYGLAGLILAYKQMANMPDPPGESGSFYYVTGTQKQPMLLQRVSPTSWRRLNTGLNDEQWARLSWFVRHNGWRFNRNLVRPVLGISNADYSKLYQALNDADIVENGAVVQKGYFSPAPAAAASQDMG